MVKWGENNANNLLHQGVVMFPNVLSSLQFVYWWGIDWLQARLLWRGMQLSTSQNEQSWWKWLLKCMDIGATLLSFHQSSTFIYIWYSTLFFYNNVRGTWLWCKFRYFCSIHWLTCGSFCNDNLLCQALIWRQKWCILNYKFELSSQGISKLLSH